MLKNIDELLKDISQNTCLPYQAKAEGFVDDLRQNLCVLGITAEDLKRMNMDREGYELIKSKLQNDVFGLIENLNNPIDRSTLILYWVRIFIELIVKTQPLTLDGLHSSI